jgi:diacylglycerol kinase (ATP)
LHDKFFHILNPSRKHRANVRRFFKNNDALESAWVDRSSHPTHLETIVQWAVAEGRHRIAVWGGDGTLSRVVQTLYEAQALNKVMVGLVPAGTCNDFARKIGIPVFSRRPVESVMIQPVAGWFDVGLLDLDGKTRVFVNNAGFGRTREALSRKRASAVKDILSFTPKTMDLEWGGNGNRHFETCKLLLGVVFNAPFFNGGMHFQTDIEANDGILNGFFEMPQRKAGLLWKFAKSRFGKPLADERTLRLDGAYIRAESDHDLYPQVDGEPATLDGVRSLRFSVLPKALEIVQL